MSTELLERIRERTATDVNGCWIWQLTIDRNGYPQICCKDPDTGRWVTKRAHRLAWQEANGPVPDGLTVDHLCNVPSCCNPDHMRVCTVAENLHAPHSMTTPHALSLRTHCMRGHEFSPENTLWRKGTDGRACRICRREADQRRQAARRAAQLSG